MNFVRSTQKTIRDQATQLDIEHLTPQHDAMVAVNVTLNHQACNYTQPTVLLCKYTMEHAERLKTT